MFKKNIKDTLFYVVVVILYFLISVLLGNLFVKFSKNVSAVANSAQKVVVIDAGHGGEDGGASSLDGKILEKDINLKIAKKLNDFLRRARINTVMIREEDKAVYGIGEENKALRRKKVGDLKNRVKIANASESNILVSIHQNKYTDENYSGTQIFYSENNENSRILADFIKNEIKEKLQPENKRENKKVSKEIYLLRHAKVPAVIVECGFLSNKEEASNLANEGYQSKLAEAICEGIKKFLDSKNEAIALEGSN